MGDRMSALDDEEQLAYIRAWNTKKRRMQREILLARQGKKPGLSGWIRMWLKIHRIRRRYR